MISLEKKTKLHSIGDILAWGETQFSKAKIYFGHGTDNAWDEAVSIVRYVMHFPPDVDRSVLELVPTDVEKDAILELLQRRIDERIPAAYLTHEAWFAGLSFYVDQRVLIPRSPIAELIEKQFRPWINPDQVKHIIDIGTGSGCIAIAAAIAFPQAIVDATDISDEALQVAKINVKKHNVADRINLIKSDVFGDVPPKAYDIILSNPPYVALSEQSGLPAEYHHEPSGALFAGVTGLDIVEQILQQAIDHLTKYGILIIEVGNSERAIIEKFPRVPFLWLNFERGGDGVFILTKDQLKKYF